MVDAKNSSKLLTDWIKLSNEAASQEKDIPAERHKQLCYLCSSLFELLDTNQSSQFINDVCQQLIVLFRSKKRQLCLLVLEFVPSLVWSYASSRSKSQSCLEACLLTLYNLNLNFKQSTEGELPCVTIPSLGRSSVYHEPENLSCTILTETALSRYDQGDRKIPLGPFPQVEKLNAKTRLPVLTHLLRCYNSDIGLFSASSHIQMCHLAIKLSCTGFKTYLSTKLLPQSKTAQTSLVNRPRIVVSPELLCELVHGVYFIMFNGKPELGFEALESVHQRANYELYSNVLLLTNSIKNSLEHNPSGQPYDGPMGVTISITPAHILTSLNKQAITNASFKTQKLPDDITPADGEGDPASDQEGDHKSSTAISAVDKQSKLLKPLKTAFKRVERSITQKKESRDNTPSPAKTDKSDKSDKVDGHNKISRQPSSGKDKEKPSNQHEMTTMNSSPLPTASHVSWSAQTASPAAVPEISPEKLEFVDTFENGVDDSFHTLDIDKIEIIIEPPDEDITTKM